MSNLIRIFSRRWPYAIILTNIVLVMATWITSSNLLPSSMIEKMLKHLSLATELNVGAWWSTSLLWLTAFLAYELYMATRTGTRPAWLILATVFAILSWDEIGSFHERIGDDGWSAFAPYMVMFGLLLAFAFLTLLRVQARRRAILMIVFGFALLAAVPLQEYLTNGTQLWTDDLTGTAIALEEGTELFGISLCLFGVLSCHRRYTAGPATGHSDPSETTITRHLITVITLIMVLSALASYAAGAYTDMPRRGDPSVWAPAVILITVAVAAARRSADTAKAAFGILAIACLVASVAVVYVLGRRYLNAMSLFNVLLLVSVFASGAWRLLHTPSRPEIVLIGMLLLVTSLSYLLASFGATSVGLTALLIMIASEFRRSQQGRTPVVPTGKVDHAARLQSLKS